MYAARFASMLLFVTPLACKGDDGQVDEGQVPDGCAEAFADKGEFFCGASYDAACLSLSADAESPVKWLIGWAQDPPTQHEVECAQAWLDDSGLVGPATNSLYFEVEGSYAQIEELCRATMIAICEPSAVDGACDDLDEAACAANPLCGDIRGTRIPDGQMCLESGVWAGCIGVGTVCPAVEVAAEHEDGSCWIFAGGCLPHEGWTIAPDTCPDSSMTDAYPSCE